MNTEEPSSNNDHSEQDVDAIFQSMMGGGSESESVPAPPRHA